MKCVAGIVLAGGHSRRMGTPKATLPFGSELLLQRVVRLVSEAASPVIVVAATDQTLPPLPPEVIIARDKNPDRGPLEAVAAGLKALQSVRPKIEIAFITACDTPLLAAGFITGMAAFLDDQHDAAVPVLDDVPQPLSGVFRTDIFPTVESLLIDNCLRLRDLLQRIRVRLVPAEALRDIDPELNSLRNLNTPDDYQAALAIAGLDADNRTGIVF
jgi:molybdenum cofactor guanylyltransferase